MIKIDQIKVPISSEEPDFSGIISGILQVKKEDIEEFSIIRRSVDARKKPELFAVYSVSVSLKNKMREKRLSGRKNVSLFEPVIYRLPDFRKVISQRRPVIAGSGPAGLFCALILAHAGLRPIVVERGNDVDTRVKDVSRFWLSGKLDTESNIQFGEGGAGTFSDGKLNTNVNDKNGRQRFVLEEFVRAGASEEILFSNTPHIGTDVLVDVVKNIRKKITELGGEFMFSSKMTDILIRGGKVEACVCGGQKIETDKLVVAVGHSARDTFEMLFGKNVFMIPKAFAVGVRVQHSQSIINISQYGGDGDRFPYPAAYKLTHNTKEGRGVYSFCMCPGGFVVNASSENGMLAVNGMSRSRRDSDTANSAIVVTVTPEDYLSYVGDSGGNEVFSGIEFQRLMEKRSFDAGNGKIPTDFYGNFKNGRNTVLSEPSFYNFEGAFEMTDISGVFPDAVRNSIIEGMDAFGKKIRGFNAPETLLSAVESRTSSPIRIPRDEKMESNIRGLYPCGEGAGYAGGIMSAAMDGMKVAEKIIESIYSSHLQ
ncbi:MAG: NAD(P)/FAD-dependent oxidoreductase [Lachnospiraceae bacterium]|jgi:uncharacterized FAD-dependent dehydrogenase